jgi:hypothetical protein
MLHKSKGVIVMASAKQFLGKGTMSNKRVAEMVKSGTKLRILEIQVKETPGSKEECLAFRPKGYETWIRINASSVAKLANTYGDDTDDWTGQDVVLEYTKQQVKGSDQLVFTLRPA